MIIRNTETSQDKNRVRKNLWSLVDIRMWMQNLPKLLKYTRLVIFENKYTICIENIFHLFIDTIFQPLLILIPSRYININLQFSACSHIFCTNNLSMFSQWFMNVCTFPWTVLRTLFEMKSPNHQSFTKYNIVMSVISSFVSV